MRTIFLVLSLFLLQATSFAEGKFNFGVKFGLVNSSIKHETKNVDQFTPNYSSVFKDNRNGPLVGGFTEFNLINYLSFNFELNYMQRGAQAKFPVTTVEDPDGSAGNYAIYDFQLDYLQSLIAVQPTFNFMQTSIYGKFGLTLNYLLKASGYAMWYNAKDLSLGHSWGFGIKLNKIFDYTLLLEICRDMDFSEFYSDSIVKMKNEAWVFKFGIIL